MMGENEISNSNSMDDEKKLGESPWKSSSTPIGVAVDAQIRTNKTLPAQQKINGTSQYKSSHRHMPMRQLRVVPRPNPIAVPPFPIPFPYNHPGILPIGHTMVPVPHVPVPGYAFQPPLGPPSAPETNLVNPRQVVVPPINGGFQTSSQADPNARDASNSSSNSRNRLNVQDHVGRFNRAPRHFMRPPFPGQAPGFVDGARFLGLPGAILYYSTTPPGSFRVPYPPMFVPHPFASAAPMPPPSEVTLRSSIVKQIEYYFSDENLEKDYYLRSLMDDKGCVAVSLIADFKRVKRMTADISVILDALKTTGFLEVVGERIRRRDDWSKWVPAPAGQKSKQTAENPAGASLTDVKSESKSANEQGSKDISPLPPMSDKNNQYQSTANDSNNGWENTPTKGCSLATKMEVSRRVSSKALQERGTSLEQSGGHKIKIKHPRSRQGGKKKGGLTSILSEKHPDVESNDFGNTFQFDEELESELKCGMKNHYDSVERIDDEEDENIVNDQDVDKLVIVTRDLRISEGSATAPRISKPISSEHASAINDLLYYYEQELKSKQSPHNHGNPCTEIKDESSRSPCVASAVSKPKTFEHSSAVSSFEGPRNANPRRKQHKGNCKQQFLPKQRLFPSNFKNQGNSQHGLSIVSESPPSDSIGFFFGSTPPDNPVFRHSKLSASPRSNVSSSSPPAGSVPK